MFGCAGSKVTAAIVGIRLVLVPCSQQNRATSRLYDESKEMQRGEQDSKCAHEKATSAVEPLPIDQHANEESQVMSTGQKHGIKKTIRCLTINKLKKD